MLIASSALSTAGAAVGAEEGTAGVAPEEKEEADVVTTAAAADAKKSVPTGAAAIKTPVFVQV